MSGTVAVPIDILLFCPACNAQHIDKPEPQNGWKNPPHKSHLCHACGFIWRPADVETNGVASIATRGAADSPAPVFRPISVDSAIATLNSAIHADAKAVDRIMQAFTRCNRALANHLTIQVDCAGYIGPLGIINGIFGVDAEQWGAIAAVFEDGTLVKFQRLDRKGIEALQEGTP